MQSEQKSKQILGWREWLALPDLGLLAIKAKVDTGAKTSALHAFAVESFREEGVAKVRFQIHPLQKRTDIVQTCVAPIVDQRMVSDSGGHREMRYVINTTIVIGSITTQAEFTLTDRDSMQFRMLLGRSAMVGMFLVNPSASYLIGKRPEKLYRKEK